MSANRQPTHTLNQAREDLQRDKHYASDEIDVLGNKTIIYSGSQMIVWTITAYAWKRQRYLHDELTNTDVYA